LIIDSDRASRRLLRTVLETQGYRIYEAQSGEEGLQEVVECGPDVIILEAVLPDMDGVSFLRSLREWSYTPVLVLSELASDQTKVATLDSGASDYVVKPFSSAELLARLRVLQRPWPNAPDGPLLIAGDLVANLATHEIALRGWPVSLTRKEEVVFYVLAYYAGKVVTRAHLVRSVWGVDSEEKAHDLQVLVAQLRKKLEPLADQALIRTERNLGYSLLLAARKEMPAL